MIFISDIKNRERNLEVQWYLEETPNATENSSQMIKLQ